MRDFIKTKKKTLNRFKRNSTSHLVTKVQYINTQRARDLMYTRTSQVKITKIFKEFHFLKSIFHSVWGLYVRRLSCDSEFGCCRKILVGSFGSTYLLKTKRILLTYMLYVSCILCIIYTYYPSGTSNVLMCPTPDT